MKFKTKTLKKLLLITVALLGVNSIYAQHWETNLETAKSKASQEGKNILLVFSGSDWCIPCMKLEREIWESDAFKKDSEEHFVLLKADFPKRKAHELSKEQQEKNNQLAEVYNKNGLFPEVVILNKDGKVLATTGYKNLQPKEYIAMLHSLEN